jgi:cystathionine gamma-synthase
VSFRVAGGEQQAIDICNKAEVFTLGESLGGVESLIEVPQAMTHQSVEGSSAAVPADLVRVSCGIEAAADLVEDLRQAIAAVTPAAVTR